MARKKKQVEEPSNVDEKIAEQIRKRAEPDYTEQINKANDVWRSRHIK